MSACYGTAAVVAVGTAVVAVAEAVGDFAQDCADYVRNHPELVVGALVVVASVACIAVLGPGGAIILVAA